MALNTEIKKKIIANFATHSNDTGSSAVQIALLTADLVARGDHCNCHAKDIVSRLALKKIAHERRKHIKYMMKHNPQEYIVLADKLGLRIKN